MSTSARRAEEVPEEWRSLLPETQRALLAVRKNGGLALAEQVAQAIAMETARLREQRAAERTELLVEVMEGGEELDHPKMATELFEVAPGLEAWIAFTTEASLEELRQLVEAIRLRKQALAGRKRLAKL
jgi:hypothetical protein